MESFIRKEDPMQHHCPEITDFDLDVCGVLKSLMAIDELTIEQACKRLGVPVALIETPAFRQLLSPAEQTEAVK